ncbi:MAG: hypothetical protein Q8942_12485 [Bacillota bacterium]|nr:hypothetical protein [Bacillota bacterium]
MNKIKVLYDVVSVLKNKEVIKGAVKVNGTKDKKNFLSFTNEFEKNTVTGLTKAKISSEIDCDGKKVKHESTTEFNCTCDDGRLKHGLFMKFHGGHGFHEGRSEMLKRHAEFRNRSFKDKLDGISTFLGILSNIKLVENADNSSEVSFNSQDIPEELKKKIIDKHSQMHQQMREMHGGFCEDDSNNNHHKFFKELHELKEKSFVFNMKINENREIESVNIIVKGNQNEAADRVEDFELDAEIIFEN